MNRWWSQPFAPEGSAAAEGIVKQLGRPALDPLTVLVREAAQNSWDARTDSGPIDFTVDLRTLGASAETWRSMLLPGPAEESGLSLDGAITPDTAVIVVSDRNTKGLGGPLRAGQRAGPDEQPDFVQFLRNVGEPSDHEFGGGTYGFGKGIFYRLSAVGTILVDTQTSGASAGRRLMGAALSHSWYAGDHRYTGRHWWGQVSADNVPDPLLGPEAEQASAALGLPGFADGRTGTDIVILAADLGSTGTESDIRPRTIHEASTFIASSVLWNLWPKFLPDADGRYMRFAVGVDNSNLAIPSPSELDAFAPFVEALTELRTGGGTPYTRTVPPKHAGSFSLKLTAADTGEDRMLVRVARPFDGTAHHIARMRVAELIVDYVPGPPHPDHRFGYGGVFKATKESDDAFAAAEPPTHDDWISKGLTGTVRGVVQGARTFLSKQIDERLGFTGQAGGSGGQGLGELAARLATLIPTIQGTAADATGLQSRSNGPGAGPNASQTSGQGGGPSGNDPRTGPSTGRTGRVRGQGAKLVGSPVLQLHNGVPFLAARILVPASSISRTLRAEVSVVIEGGGREREVPAGAAVPRITQWQPAAGGLPVQGDAVLLSAGGESEWWVYASHVPDAVVRFSVSQVDDRAQ